MNLTIKTNYTVTTEKEIPLPAFYKDCVGDIKELIAILDEETMVRVWSYEKRTLIENQTTEGRDAEIARIDATLKEATEEEFFEEFNKAYKFLQLNPVKQYYANGMVNATI